MFVNRGLVFVGAYEWNIGASTPHPRRRGAEATPPRAGTTDNRPDKLPPSESED